MAVVSIAFASVLWVNEKTEGGGCRGGVYDVDLTAAAGHFNFGRGGWAMRPQDGKNRRGGIINDNEDNQSSWAKKNRGWE